MNTEKIQLMLNTLAGVDGIYGVALYKADTSVMVVCGDISEVQREYAQKQLEQLIALSSRYKIENKEVAYQLGSLRISFHFIEGSILAVFAASEYDAASLCLALNNTALEISKSSQEKKKENLARSRSATIDKASLPEIIETTTDFISFLKKMLNKYGSPQATNEVATYIDRKKINVDNLDSYNAYNLINHLSSMVDKKNRDSFSNETEEALKQFF